METRHEPRLHLAGIAHKGPVEAIGDTYGRMFHEVGGLEGASGYGLGLYHSARTDADVHAHICMEIPSRQNLDGEVAYLTRPPREVAVYTHHGNYDRLPQVWREVFERHLPAAGLRPAGDEHYERFLNDVTETAEADLRTELCVPLATD